MGNTIQSPDALTLREQQIADGVARGLSNKEIGEECGISHETVKRHLASIYSKLALRGRVALAIHVERSRVTSSRFPVPDSRFGFRNPSSE